MDFLGCARSYLGPNKSIKFVVEDDQTETACCIAQYLSSLPYQDSMSQFINSAVQSFHEKYHEGTSTLFTFVCLFYKCIKSAVDNGEELCCVCDSLKENLDQCISYLQTTSFNLLDSLTKIEQENYEKTVNCRANAINTHEHHPSLKMLSKSRHFKDFASVDSEVILENENSNCAFQLNDLLLKKMEDIVKRTSHGSSELVPVIFKAWVNQVEHRYVKNNCDFTLDLKRLHVLSIVGNFSTSTVVSGLVIPISHGLNIFLTQKHSRNALVISGSLKHDYKHRGYNQPLKSTFVVTANDYTNSKLNGEIWMQDILDKLIELNVNLLLVQGNVDEKLFDLCISRGIFIIEKVDTKLIAIFSTATSVSAENYILDCDVSSVVKDINMELWKLDGDKHNNDNYIKLELQTPFQTLVLCSSCLPLASIREHRTHHFIRRLSSCLIKSVEGGGEAEMLCNRYLSRNSAQPLICDVFHNFVTFVISNCSFGIDEIKPLDSFESKTESWRCALNTAISVVSTDITILVGDENSVWKNIQHTQYQFVGNL